MIEVDDDSMSIDKPNHAFDNLLGLNEDKDEYMTLDDLTNNKAFYNIKNKKN
jgi:hypothetical protein